MAITNDSPAEEQMLGDTNVDGECAECGAFGWETPDGPLIPACECGPRSRWVSWYEQGPFGERDAESHMTEWRESVSGNWDREEDRMLRALGLKS